MLDISPLDCNLVFVNLSAQIIALIYELLYLCVLVPLYLSVSFYIALLSWSGKIALNNTLEPPIINC